MIQLQSILAAADNSGAKTLMCIKVMGGTRRRYAAVGDVIKVSTPAGDEEYQIVEVSYQAAEQDGSKPT